MATYADFVEYYNRLKSVYEQHLKMFDRGSPDLPVQFTENLCRKLFNLSNWPTKTFDAVDSNQKKIEIKATSDARGTTTISKARFDYLYWMHFNFEDDILTVRIMPFSNFKGFIRTLTRPRGTITIHKFIKESDTTVHFRIGKNGFKR